MALERVSPAIQRKHSCSQATARPSNLTECWELSPRPLGARRGAAPTSALLERARGRVRAGMRAGGRLQGPLPRRGPPPDPCTPPRALTAQEGGAEGRPRRTRLLRGPLQPSAGGAARAGRSHAGAAVRAGGCGEPAVTSGRDARGRAWASGGVTFPGGEEATGRAGHVLRDPCAGVAWRARRRRGVPGAVPATPT